MTRILRRPELEPAPVDVPAPPAWDSVALAAYEQGYDEGGTHGRELGRRDLREMQQQLDAAVGRCLSAIDAATQTLASRAVDVATMFVTTALRHVPEARTAGMLVRLGEVLDAFEPGSLEVSVTPDLVGELTDILAPRNAHGNRVVVVGDASLVPGEFRLHSEWADADGTFDRYLAAARDALELHLSAAHGSDRVG